MQLFAHLDASPQKPAVRDFSFFRDDLNQMLADCPAGDPNRVAVETTFRRLEKSMLRTYSDTENADLLAASAAELLGLIDRIIAGDEAEEARKECAEIQREIANTARSLSR